MRYRIMGTCYELEILELLRLGSALNRNKNAEVKMSKIFLTNDPLGVILCGESIAHTPEPWKRFLEPDSGKKSVCIEAKIKHFRIFMRKTSILRFFSRREIDCAHFRSVKTLPWPWFREGIGVLKRNLTFSDFYEKTVNSYVFLGGESIARIPELWKCFLDPDSGKE